MLGLELGLGLGLPGVSSTMTTSFKASIPLSTLMPLPLLLLEGLYIQIRFAGVSDSSFSLCVSIRAVQSEGVLRRNVSGTQGVGGRTTGSELDLSAEVRGPVVLGGSRL